MQKRCLQWLEDSRRTAEAGDEANWERHWLQAALSDLAAPENFTELESIPDRDVKLAIKHYLRSIWWIGRRLGEEGLTTNARYSDENLREFETFIEQQVGTKSAQRMMREFRRFTPILLEMCGTRSGEQMIQITKETHGLPAKETAER